MLTIHQPILYLIYFLVLIIAPSYGHTKNKVNKDPHTRLAVLEFKDEAQLPPFERALLADSVRGAVLNTPFQVMTRENMITLLPPDQTLEDCIGECEIDVGRKLGAHYIITGMIGRLDGQLQLLLRLYETRQGNLKGQYTVSANSVGELQPKVAQAGIQILEQVKPKFQLLDANTRTLLFIEYKPKHMKIKIDGHTLDFQRAKKVGQGVMLPITEGKHTIEAYAKGYVRMKKKINVGEGQPHQVNIKLQRSYRNKMCYTGACQGDLFIYTKPAGAHIYLNGKSTKKVTKTSSHDPRLGSLALSLPAGKYWVSARKNSYQSAERLIEIKAGGAYNGFRHKPLSLKKTWSSLKISSRPIGAIVRLNGEVVGKTPFEKKHLVSKPYWLEVMAEGYQSKEQLIFLKAGKKWKQHWQLSSNKTRLELSVSYKGKAVKGASLWINDELLGESDEKGLIVLKELPHGVVDLQVRHPLYVAYHNEIQLKPGKTFKKKIKLQGAFAYLSIKAPADTAIQHIIWAGQSLAIQKGDTHQVPAGKYWLQIRPQNEEHWQPYREKMRLEVGESKEVIPHFIPHRAWLTVTSVPTGAKVYLDDKAMGKTPVKIRSTSGSHELKLTLKDKPTYQQILKLSKGRNQQKVDFNKRTLLEISCHPKYSEVFVNHQLVGRSPQKLDMSPGQHQVACVLGNIRVEKSAQILPGMTHQTHIQLDPNIFKKARRAKESLAWVGKGILFAGLSSFVVAGSLWLGPGQSALEERDIQANGWLGATSIENRNQAYQSWSVADQQAQYYDQWAQRSTMIGAILSAVGLSIWGYAHYSKIKYLPRQSISSPYATF